MRKIIVAIILFLSLSSQAQDYNLFIDSFRKHYIAELLAEPRKPVKDSEAQYLRFFPADINYKVDANFTKVIDTIGFIMETHSGVIRKYFKYGQLDFLINKKKQRLFIYQSEKLLKDSNYKDHLFLPFNDLTNNRTTYGGGRYIDLKISDIKNDKVIVDFNTCYNPYCAFAGGFNCPIPPSENKLKVKITAGEKIWAKVVE